VLHNTTILITPAQYDALIVLSAGRFNPLTADLFDVFTASTYDQVWAARRLVEAGILCEIPSAGGAPRYAFTTYGHMMATGKVVS
jgi:hypothetical protein